MFIIMTASAQVKGKARNYGPYSHIAIVELEPDFDGKPSMISERAKGVRRVVADSGSMWSGGGTERSAWVRTVGEYKARCDELNAAERRNAKRRAARQARKADASVSAA